MQHKLIVSEHDTYSHNELAKVVSKSKLTYEQMTQLLIKSSCWRDGHYLESGKSILLENSRTSLKLDYPIIKAGGNLYEIRESLSKGGQGDIFAVFSLSSKMFSVMKRINVSVDRMSVMHESLSEKSALEDHGWSNDWTQYSEKVNDDKDDSTFLGHILYYCQFMPYLGENLKNHLDKSPHESRKIEFEAHRWRVAADACWGVYQLGQGFNIYHKHPHTTGLGYGHRDIKPTNMVWNGTRVRIIDLGFAKTGPEGANALVARDRGTEPYIMPTNTWCPISSFDLYAMQISLKKTIYQSRRTKRKTVSYGILTDRMIIKTPLKIDVSYNPYCLDRSLFDEIENSSEYIDYLINLDSKDHEDLYFPAQNILTLTAVMIATPMPNMTYGKLQTIASNDILAASIIGHQHSNPNQEPVEQNSKIKSLIQDYENMKGYYLSPSDIYFATEQQKTHFSLIREEFNNRANFVCFGLDDCVEDALKNQFLCTILASTSTRLVKLAAARLFRAGRLTPDSLTILESHNAVPKLCIRAHIDGRIDILDFILNDDSVLPALQVMEQFDYIDEFDFFLSHPQFIPYLITLKTKLDVLFLRGLLEEGVDSIEEFENFIRDIKNTPKSSLSNLRRLIEDPIYKNDELKLIISQPVLRQTWRWFDSLQVNSAILHELLIIPDANNYFEVLRSFPLDIAMLNLMIRHFSTIKWLLEEVKSKQECLTGSCQFLDCGSVLNAFLTNKDYRKVVLLIEQNEKEEERRFRVIFKLLFDSYGLIFAPVILSLHKNNIGIMKLFFICNDEFFPALCIYMSRTSLGLSKNNIQKIPYMMSIKKTLIASCSNGSDFNTVSPVVFNYFLSNYQPNNCLFKDGFEYEKCKLILLLCGSYDISQIYEHLNHEIFRRYFLKKYLSDNNFVKSAIVLDRHMLCTMENLELLAKDNDLRNKISFYLSFYFNKDDIIIRIMCARLDITLDYPRTIPEHILNFALSIMKYFEPSNFKKIFSEYLKLCQSVKVIKDEYAKYPYFRTTRMFFAMAVEDIEQIFESIHDQNSKSNFLKNIERFLFKIKGLINNDQVSISVENMVGLASYPGCLFFFNQNHMQLALANIISAINSLDDILNLRNNGASQNTGRVYVCG